MCGLPLFQGCGRGRSQLALRGVSSILPFVLGSLTSISILESFAATGWRVGWLVGPESIIKPTLAASTRIVFCSNSPLQEAAAAGLERAKAHDFFAIQTREYAERRDVLVKVFDDLGMKYTLPQGSYFILLVCQSVVPTPSSLSPFAATPFEPIGYIRT
jgi:aspartate/methionine/tyrosine aminotransferase